MTQKYILNICGGHGSHIVRSKHMIRIYKFVKTEPKIQGKIFI